MVKSFFRKFNKFLFYLKYNFKRQLRIFFKIDQIIYIDDKKIILPPGHLLSLYESVYPKYDRFLPTVIGKIKEKCASINNDEICYYRYRRRNR